MTHEQMHRIFQDLDFVHTSGSPEELRAAQYLADACQALGVPARIEPFAVPMADVHHAEVLADGQPIPCQGVSLCGSGSVEGELYYMPGQDPVSIAGAKDKIVLLDTQGIGHFAYQDLVKAGAKGILFQYGNLHYDNRDIDRRDLRPAVVGEAKKLLCAMLHVETGLAMVKNRVRRVKITVDQREYEGQSQNVVAELPGKRPEYLTLTAHYDSTSLSHGSYDNLSGCVGLLGVMDALRSERLNYGLRFVFCGSEERGLLGSKAYVKAHEPELDETALNINLDMIGTYVGKFIARVSAEEALVHYLTYLGAEIGFPIAAKTGVYSSDSTPFADKGVPALSFARLASNTVAPIHCRFDTPEVLSMDQMAADIDFITAFTRRMAQAVVCPVKREIPEKVRKELDEYLFRKRKEP